MILLAVSFLLSLFSVWRSAGSAEKAKRKAAVAEEREKNIDLGVQKAVNRFDEVLNKQRETGERIAGDIDNSTTKLNQGIDDSTALLRSRVDDSITLLNDSTERLKSLSDPITSLKLSVSAELPLTDEVFKNYREKLKGLAKPGENIVRISGQSQQPDPQDMAASNILSALERLHVICSLYKTPLSKAALTQVDLPPADLTMEIFGVYSLSYDIKSDTLKFYVPEGLFFPRNDPRLTDPSYKSRPPVFQTLPWFKKPGGSITSVADLRNSQLTVEIRVDPDHEVITRKVRMTALSIFISHDVLELSYLREGVNSGGWAGLRASTFYNIPLMKEVTRNHGTLYFYPMPSSMAELITRPKS
jgi:hypothetical protein